MQSQRPLPARRTVGGKAMHGLRDSLCRNADTCLKMFRIFLERLYKRSHLYRFGTGTENEQYLFHLLYL